MIGILSIIILFVTSNSIPVLRSGARRSRVGWSFGSSIWAQVGDILERCCWSRWGGDRSIWLEGVGACLPFEITPLERLFLDQGDLDLARGDTITALGGIDWAVKRGECEVVCASRIEDGECYLELFKVSTVFRIGRKLLTPRSSNVTSIFVLSTPAANSEISTLRPD